MFEYDECTCPRMGIHSIDDCYYYLDRLVQKFDAMIDQMQSTAIGHFQHTQYLFLCLCLKYSNLLTYHVKCELFCCFASVGIHYLNGAGY